MNRRDFLNVFGTMTAAAVALPLLDLDALVWVPKPIVVVPTMSQFGAIPLDVWDAVKIEYHIACATADMHGTMFGDRSEKAQLMNEIADHWATVGKQGELSIRQTQVKLPGELRPLRNVNRLVTPKQLLD